MTAIQFYNISNFAIYCKIIAMYIAIYQPLCRNILQIFYRAIQFLAEPKIHSVLKKISYVDLRNKKSEKNKLYLIKY